MVGALIGIACGILVATAMFGIAGQVREDWAALQRGARFTGLLGTIILLVSFLAHGAGSLSSFFDATGRALIVATVGLITAWRPVLRDRLLTIPADTSLWWSLGVVAILAAWAEFAPADGATSHISMLTVQMPLMIAAGLAVSVGGRALTALQSAYVTLRIGRDRYSFAHCASPQDALLRENGALGLSIATGIVLLALLSFGIQNLFVVGMFWPETAGFRAIASVWLILFSACLMCNRAAGTWLSILGVLVLIVLSLLPVASV